MECTRRKSSSEFYSGMNCPFPGLSASIQRGGINETELPPASKVIFLGFQTFLVSDTPPSKSLMIWLTSLSLCCGKVCITNFTILTNFKVLQHLLNSRCYAAIIPLHLQNFFIFPTDSLYPLNTNSHLPFAQLWQTPFYFLFLRIWLFKAPHRRRIIQWLSFCNWLV